MLKESGVNMDYKLFIDDLRFPTTPDWFVARNSFEAINALYLYGCPTEIAFDHDLGGQDTSMVFVKKFANMLLDGEISLPTGFKYSIHSANPVGARNIHSFMEQLLEEIE